MAFVLPTLEDLETARALICQYMPPTPQYSWPLLNARAGTEVWVKHENHTPLATFKIRGALVYLNHLRQTMLSQTAQDVTGVITATRGNYGQAIGFAAAKVGLPAVVVVPRGNGREKNAAMRSLGVELVEHGDDFQASSEYADQLAEERVLHRVPSVHPLLIQGVGVYWMEFLRAVSQLDVIYAPIGLGSGICGLIAARRALGLNTELIGVVSAHAPAYALSWAARKPISHKVTTALADGVACRTPDADALETMLGEISRIVTATDDEVALAMRALFHDTHNAAEGAGALGLAAILREKSQLQSCRVGTVVSGGNVDTAVFASVLAGERVSRPSECG
jgi:threonine dehydratase